MKQKIIPMEATKETLLKYADQETLYTVDSNHPTLKTINGNVYDKTGKELLLVSNFYKENPFFMPDSVTTIRSEACQGIIDFGHISVQLKDIECDAIVSGQKMDLRNTACNFLRHLCPDTFPIFGQTMDYFRFPLGNIKDYRDAVFISEKYDLLTNSGTLLLAIYDTDGDYIVPESVTEVMPRNSYLDLEHKRPLHFKTFTLSRKTQTICDTLLNHDVVERFLVPPDNENFFNFRGCLYSRRDSEYTLIHIPKECTKLHILEGTTCIASNAASDMTFEKIFFPKTIKQIEYNAFSNCVFPEVTHVYAQRIQSQAFYRAKGGRLYLHSISDCGVGCFEESNFSLIDMSDMQIQSIWHRMFMLASIGQIIMPPELRTLDVAAFKHAKIDVFDASNTKLKHIGNQAFCQSTLKQVILPKTVTLIDKLAFNKTQLKTFTLITEDKVRINTQAFSENPELETVEIPNANIIETKAFYNDSALVNVTFSDDTDIAASAFYKTKIKKKK